MNVNIADATVSVILVRLLVPNFGIAGYIAVLYIAEIFNFALSAARLLKRCRFKFRIFKWFILPLGLLILTSKLCQWAFLRLSFEAFPGWLKLTLHVAIIILIFTSLLSITASADKEFKDWLAVSIGLKSHPDLDDRGG
jgi:stage V sporulation protein B